MTVSARFAALVTLVLAVGLSGCAVSTSALADPSPTVTSATPVRAIDIATGVTDERVDVSVGGADGVGVTFREITLAPGAGTGEHCHDGQLLAVVKQGALTHYAPTHPGGVRVYEEGDAIVEGPGYVHQGVNEGDEDVVLWVTYVIPEGDPLAETDLSLCER